MTPLAAMLAQALSGPLLQAVLEALRAAREGRASEAGLEARLHRAIVTTVEKVATTELEARRAVLTAELGGESRIQRLWRPVVALCAFFSYWFVVVAYPFLLSWGLLPRVRFGEAGLHNLFFLAAVSTGGYIGGRTLEKVAATLARRST